MLWGQEPQTEERSLCYDVFRKYTEFFIRKIKDGAQAAQQKYGILASVTIAQAILGSDWGQHTIANNLWGVAASVVMTLLGFFIWYIQSIKNE